MMSFFAKIKEVFLKINFDFLFVLTCVWFIVPYIVKYIAVRFYDDYYTFLTTDTSYLIYYKFGISLAVCLILIYALPKLTKRSFYSVNEMTPKKANWADKTTKFFVLLMLISGPLMYLTYKLFGIENNYASITFMFVLAFSLVFWSMLGFVILFFEIVQYFKDQTAFEVLIFNLVFSFMFIFAWLLMLVVYPEEDRCYISCIEEGHTAQDCSLNICDF